MAPRRPGPPRAGRGHALRDRVPLTRAEGGAAAGGLEIRPLASDAEARRCAEIMAGSEPWITLSRSFEASLIILRAPDQEVYVAVRHGGVLGFVILVMRGAFVGYIRTVAVAPEVRGTGVGSRLIAFAEERILRDSPNVFMCVSDFNHRAQALYARLGYERVGELRDYIVRGHAEILLRKSTGPLNEFRAGPEGGRRKAE